MPEISRFYGIVIRMFYNEHAPPHFHAIYAGVEVVINIRTLAVIRGKLPARAMGLVIEWASLHQDELMLDWDRARQEDALLPIEPLP
jgi:hypothetical protein